MPPPTGSGLAVAGLNDSRKVGSMDGVASGVAESVGRREPVGPDPVLAQAARTATRVRLRTRRMMSPWLDSIERRGCTFGSSQGGCCAVRATAVGCARVRNVHTVLTNRPLPPMPIALFLETTASSDPLPSEPARGPHQHGGFATVTVSLPMPWHRTFVVVVALALALGALVPAFSPPPTRAASSSIVISQVYGGGGNAGATYTHDFIELFNLGAVAVDVSTWSVQYASNTGTSWQRTNPTGSIAPGAYYLVQQAAGAGGTTAL